MTWADYLNDGRGKVGYRLRIEGLQYEFVTASGMEAGESVLLLAEGGGLILDSDGGITLTELADGVSRVACLSHDGIGWKERADIVGGRLEVDGFTVRIVDRQIDQVVTRALAWQPTTLNWVDADIAVAATDAITTVSVLSSADFAVGDFVHIGTECMEVTDVPSGTSVDLRRGQRNTIPQAHSVGVGENLAYPVMAKDRPLSIEGRRANLYAYGSGDDLTGSGTLVFRGVCATDAKLDANGADWRITIDSITRMMDAPISGDIAEQVGSRGIFYNWTAPLVIDAYEISGPAVVERLRVVVPSADYPQAFFETQQDLTDYLNSAIQAESGGFATWEIANLRAVSEGADDWFLEMTMGATVARQSVATAGSVIDGYLQDYYDSTGTVFPAIVVGTTAGALTALETYQIRAAAGSRNSVESVPNSVVRRVPRAFWGRADEAGWRRADVTEIVAPSSAPMTRIYVGGSGSLFGITAVRMEWPNGEEAFYVVSAVDETDRWIEVNNGLPIAPPGSSGYGFGNDVKIRLIRSLGRGSLEVVRNTVANASPFLANEGGLPFMTTEELASWTTEVERAARGKAWATDRVYYADEEMSFADYLAEECKAIGVFPVINDDGKIAVKRMRAPASTEPTAEEVDGTEVAIDLGRPSWERNAWGRYNQVAYSWSYDPAEQEHRNDGGSAGRDRVQRKQGGQQHQRRAAVRAYRPVPHAVRACRPGVAVPRDLRPCVCAGHIRGRGSRLLSRDAWRRHHHHAAEHPQPVHGSARAHRGHGAAGHARVPGGRRTLAVGRHRQRRPVGRLRAHPAHHEHHTPRRRPLPARHQRPRPVPVVPPAGPGR